MGDDGAVDPAIIAELLAAAPDTHVVREHDARQCLAESKSLPEAKQRMGRGLNGVLKPGELAEASRGLQAQGVAEVLGALARAPRVHVSQLGRRLVARQRVR